MGHSEDYIRNKMYELEKAKVEIERNKLKVLSDIRDELMIIHAMFAIEIEAKAKSGKYAECNTVTAGKAISEIKERIEKRWSE